MVGHDVFFDDSRALPNEVRLAPPRLDFRWRLTTQEAAAQHPTMDFSPDGDWEEDDFLENDDIYYAEPEIAPPPPPKSPKPPRFPTPPANSEPVAASSPPSEHELIQPHIMLLEIAKMHEDEWRLARIDMSADKSYAFLTLRGSRLSLKQAIKRREALVITLDKDGKVTVQDLRKTAPRKKDSWLKNVFGWF